MRQEGLLNRFNLAFSRDQPHKIYVQHRMLEESRDIYAWLEEGAYFYVCGDAARMAKDVDVALHQIIEKEGSRTPEAAAEYVEAMQESQALQTRCVLEKNNGRSSDTDRPKRVGQQVVAAPNSTAPILDSTSKRRFAFG